MDILFRKGSTIIEYGVRFRGLDRIVDRTGTVYIMKRNNRTGNRLRLIPLILGGYGAFLGLGLIGMGLSEMKEGIGIVRFLIGLGMTGFSLLGIWDGVRDLIKPKEKDEAPPVRQFILTDTSGIKSSHVTPELLRKQMDILAESEDYKNFDLQILPPLPAGEYGILKQIVCVYHDNVIMMAFFEMTKDGHRMLQKSIESDMAVEWLKQLLAGSPDFSEWKKIEINAQQDEEDTQGVEEELQQGEEDTQGGKEELQQDEEDTQGDEVELQQDEEDTQGGKEELQQDEEDTQGDEVELQQDEEDTQRDEEGLQQDEEDAQREKEDTQCDEENADTKEMDTGQDAKSFFLNQLRDERKGRQITYWHKLLVVFGESWHDEHKFFSARDVELVVEGIYEGKYQKAVLEWGMQEVDLFCGVQNEVMVIWCTNNTEKGNARFWVREGTVAQVKFWLAGYMECGYFEVMDGWADMTAQIEKEKRRGEKKHGKVF